MVKVDRLSHWSPYDWFGYEDPGHKDLYKDPCEGSYKDPLRILVMRIHMRIDMRILPRILPRIQTKHPIGEPLSMSNWLTSTTFIT